MATLAFSTQGIEVGYGTEGFFAFGETSNYEFDEREYVGHPLPQFRYQPISWRIDTGGVNHIEQYTATIQMEQYTANITIEQYTAKKQRADIVKSVFGKIGQPIGMFRKWGPDAISLSYSLPNDPAFATFVMGVMASDRELSFWCQGFNFVDEGIVAAAPSVSGFLENGDPVFLCDRPIIRVR